MADESVVSPEIDSYQIRYLSQVGVQDESNIIVTEIIEATDVHMDDGDITFWHRNNLIFLISRDSVQLIRTISKLDMKLPKDV